MTEVVASCVWVAAAAAKLRQVADLLLSLSTGKYLRESDRHELKRHSRKQKALSETTFKKTTEILLSTRRKSNTRLSKIVGIEGACLKSGRPPIHLSSVES